MFCPHCGTEIADDSVFCESCGKPVDVAPVAAEAAADAQAAVASLDAVVEDATTVVAPAAETQVLGADQTVVQSAPAPVAPAPVVASVEPTQVMPTPVSAAPTTQGYAAPMGASAPSQAGYASAPAVPAYNAAPVKKGLPLPAVIAGAILAAALAFFGIRSLVAPKVTAEPEPTPVETPAEPESGETETSEAEGSGTETSETEAETPAEPAPASFAAECTDANGNPTIYACLELTGAELNELCAANGYEWTDEGEGWIKPDNSGFVGVSPRPDSSYTQDEIAGLAAGGGSTPAYYALWMSGYDTAQAAFEGLNKTAVVDSEYIDDELGMAVVSDSAGQKYLALTMLMDDGDFAVTIYNEAAVANGAFDDMLGGEFGASIDEVWETINGRTPGA